MALIPLFEGGTFTDLANIKIFMFIWVFNKYKIMYVIIFYIVISDVTYSPQLLYSSIIVYVI